MKFIYQTLESEHYIFNFLEDSFAAEHIEEIVLIQEQAFKKITSFFKIDVSFKIVYYLLETPEQVGVAFGDNEACNGFAEEPNIIYAVYSKRIKCIGPHEDAHIISYLINKPTSAFVREGLAMYFDEYWWNKINTIWVKEFLKDGNYVKIEELIDDNNFFEHNDAITYPISGAFTKFLIDTYGREKYTEFYRLKVDIRNAITKTYGKSIEQLEFDFLIHLDKFQIIAS
jgi:hypothetical protein